jgi:hypothetical protein
VNRQIEDSMSEGPAPDVERRPRGSSSGVVPDEYEHPPGADGIFCPAGCRTDRHDSIPVHDVDSLAVRGYGKPDWPIAPLGDHDRLAALPVETVIGTRVLPDATYALLPFGATTT